MSAPDRPAALRPVLRWLGRHWTTLLLAAALLVLLHRVYPLIDVGGDAGAPPAPDVELAREDGRPFRLHDLRGQIVVLNFWATWCPPCRAEMPGFAALHRELAPRGVVFVGVSVDEGGYATLRPFLQEHDVPYLIVADDGSASAQFGGIGTLPTTFLLDREGRIRYRHEGLLLKQPLRRALEQLLASP